MRSIRQMARDVLGTEKADALETSIDKLRSGDKLVISRSSGNEIRLALVRGGSTIHTEIGPARQVFDNAIRFMDPLSLDGVRKVRSEPNGPKVN